MNNKNDSNIKSLDLNSDLMNLRYTSQDLTWIYSFRNSALIKKDQPVEGILIIYSRQNRN